MDGIGSIINQLEENQYIDELDDLKNDVVVKSGILEFGTDSDESTDLEQEESHKSFYHCSDGVFQNDPGYNNVPFEVMMNRLSEVPGSSSETILPDCPNKDFEGTKGEKNNINFEPSPLDFVSTLSDHAYSSCKRLKLEPDTYIDDIMKEEYEGYSNQDDLMVIQKEEFTLPLSKKALNNSSQNIPDENIPVPAKISILQKALTDFVPKEEVADISDPLYIKTEQPDDFYTDVSSNNDDNKDICESSSDISFWQKNLEETSLSPEVLKQTADTPVCDRALELPELPECETVSLESVVQSNKVTPSKLALQGDFLFKVSTVSDKSVNLRFTCLKCGETELQYLNTINHICVLMKEPLPTLLCSYCQLFVASTFKKAISHFAGATEYYRLSKRIKSYKCFKEKCDFVTLSSSCLKMHFASKHFEVGSTNSKDAHIPDSPKLTSFCLHCPLCHNKFLELSALKWHMKVCHKKTRSKAFRFACTLCSYKAVFISSLRVHLMYAHGMKMDELTPMDVEKFSIKYKGTHKPG